MGRSRLEIEAFLRELLGSDNVYFQPPPSIRMLYPAIVWSRDSSDVDFAENAPYRIDKRYQVTVIDRDPDSLIPDKVEKLPTSSFQRHFTADNLNHDIFNVYF